MHNEQCATCILHITPSPHYPITPLPHYPITPLPHSFARVAPRFLDVSAALVPGDLRVLTHQALPYFHAVLVVGNDELVRSLPALFPLFDHAERVEIDVFGAIRAGTVAHRGHHEEAHRFLHGAGAHLRQDILVIVDRDLWRHRGV